MDKAFPDHFSGHAAEYAKARPRYPTELYDYLAQLAPGKKCAWDCATGSGQAAAALAERFESVIATDASAQQISQATQVSNVTYQVAQAEDCGIESGSVDLITVAQAVHWFDFDRFYDEVKRVAAPRAVIALWSYGLTRVNNRVDAIVDDFYRGEIADFWPEQRSHVDSEYKSIPFPFSPCTSPEFEMSAEWSADEFLAYLRTWSSVKRFEAALGRDPVERIASAIEDAWLCEVCRVSWPLILRVGRCC